jgi:hypothetical protein
MGTHLNKFPRAMVAAKLANLSVEKPNSANLQNNQTRAQAAEKLNVSERTVNAAKKVQQQATPELREKVERGSASNFLHV